MAGNFRDRLIRGFPILKDMLKRTSKTLIKVKLVAGGVAGAIACAGILKGDELVAVLADTSGTIIIDSTAEFLLNTDRGNKVRLDGYIDNTGGTSTASKSLIVIWIPWEDR